MIYLVRKMISGQEDDMPGQEDDMSGQEDDTGLSLAYFAERTLICNGLEYCFRGLFVSNPTFSYLFWSINQPKGNYR